MYEHRINNILKTVKAIHWLVFMNFILTAFLALLVL